MNWDTLQLAKLFEWSTVVDGSYNTDSLKQAVATSTLRDFLDCMSPLSMPAHLLDVLQHGLQNPWEWTIIAMTVQSNQNHCFVLN